ncbi:hypothetical protein [Actinomadura sp. 9N407]|uniref:hypothetical protein n=1 Tax=Actinomadura sp. 9N407 TaxID=3375154 RepID=UPI0037B1883B
MSTETEAKPDEIDETKAEPEPEDTENKEIKEPEKHEPEKHGPEKHGGKTKRAFSKGTALKAIGVLALAASVATAGLQWRAADEAAQREADRKAVQERAGQFGQALLSYDHTNLQAARNKVLSLASDDFAKTYDVAFTGGLEGVITKLKATATATVRSVYLSQVDGASAKAVVVMDSEVRSSAGTRRVLGSYLDMRLARQGGGWRITEVTSIGAVNESMTDPKGKQQGTPQGNPASPGG